MSNLLAEIRDPDDHLAWERFVNMYSPLIHRFCRTHGLQEADALDVTQDVVIQVSRSISTFEYDRSKGRFRSWLGTIARNRILRHWKQKQRRQAGENVAEQQLTTSEGLWTDLYNAHILESALEHVRRTSSDAKWKAFELAWLRDTPAVDVARMMDRRIEWVYKTKSQLLQKLKAQVEFLAADIAVLSK